MQNYLTSILKTGISIRLSATKKFRQKIKRRIKICEWLFIILLTLTTLLAAVMKIGELDMQYFIVVSSASVTFLTSALKTFQNQEL
jgi:hypothetical protein